VDDGQVDGAHDPERCRKPSLSGAIAGKGAQQGDGVVDERAEQQGGQLRIPRPGNDKLPAIILLQASGGFGANLNRWLRELNEMDVATFALDSFAVAHDANATEATVSAVKPILRSTFKLN